MYDAQEPLDEGLVLVPPVYNVLLHLEAYQALQALLPRVEQQARHRLDDELVRLNKRNSRALGWFRRFVHQLKRLFSAERYVQRLYRGAASYERAGEAWRVIIGVTSAPDADAGYLAVETDFDTEVPMAYRGRPTINIVRRTVVRPDGRFETVVTARRPGGTLEPKRRGTQPLPASNPLARLSFEDENGRHIYYMTKSQISIGRQDGGVAGTDVALSTMPDVSREHAFIRHDAESGTFTIKDTSRYGLTVDGEPVPARVGGQEEHVDDWYPLPRKAEVGLADVIFITFEALQGGSQS